MEQIGRTAIMFALSEGELEEQIRKQAETKGFKMIKGKVGSMSTEKIFAAVETAAQREGLIRKNYLG